MEGCPAYWKALAVAVYCTHVFSGLLYGVFPYKEVPYGGRFATK